MEQRDALVREFFSLVDKQDWVSLPHLIADDIEYDRPGYETISGVAEFMRFYSDVREIRNGEHDLAAVLTSNEEGFCWGRFRGFRKSGEAVDVAFADWYRFAGDRIERRRSFFYQPAV